MFNKDNEVKRLAVLYGHADELEYLTSVRKVKKLFKAFPWPQPQRPEQKWPFLGGTAVKVTILSKQDEDGIPIETFYALAVTREQEVWVYQLHQDGVVILFPPNTKEGAYIRWPQ